MKRNLLPKKISEAANVATIQIWLKVNGKLIKVEKSAISGQSANPAAIAAGLAPNPRMNYIAQQLGMSHDELLDFFKMANPKDKAKVVSKFFDTEHKLNDFAKAIILEYQAKYGKNAVQVKKIEMLSLYEPCTSCKRLIITFKEIFGCESIVKSIPKPGGGFMQGNADLLKYGIK